MPNLAITTLDDELRENPHCLEELYQLRIAVDADIPDAQTNPSLRFEDFMREIESEITIKDAFFIAKEANQYIGLTCLNRNTVTPDSLNQTTTGVIRHWRNKGIAFTLKRYGIAYAKAKGYTSITTYMDSRNTPMCTLNEKLGFRPGVAAVLMERR